MATKRRLMCRSRLSFFGLADDHMRYVYEEIFILKYYGSWSFIETYNLPLTLRRWFVRRLQEQFELEKEEMEKSMK